MTPLLQAYDDEHQQGFSPRLALYRAFRRCNVTALPVIRVSSAQARGRAKQYAYWGLAEYHVITGYRGLRMCCVSRASSDRRSYTLCEQDAEQTGLPRIQALGYLTDADCVTLTDALRSQEG